MLMRNAPGKPKSLFVIYTTFFLLLSIPIVTWGVINGSFDIRNRAFEDVTVSEDNPCVISLPNVNPYTLEVGKSITVQVDATLKDAAIASLKISDSTGNLIHQESFDKAPVSIATSFKFTPFKSGTVDMLGLITKVNGGSVACKISSSYDVLGLKAMTNNLKPEFSTLPTASKPSQNIKTGISYEYTLTASDPDGDNINYSYSFTPNASWLKPTIIEDGSNGKLTIKFQGATDKAASYLANIFIHDGYSKHLASQTWVISVSPAENDIPIVKVISPVDNVNLNQGEPLRISWEASDLNQVVKYELYITQNPTDQNSWITVNNDISYKTNSYLVDTSKLVAGTYKVIVKAIDNQTPSLSGIGVSPEIVINGGTVPTQDDVVVLTDPQVINMTPTSSDTIHNKQVTIKATLIAGTNAKINDSSIVAKLDDKDITSLISINKISDQEHTVIYQPSQDLDAGLHKMEIYLKDSNGRSTTKSWTFTIQAEPTTPEGYVNIFGYEISQRTLIIVGVGILVIILAIVAPIIIFSIWKEEQYKKDETPSENDLLHNIPAESVPTPPQTDIAEMVGATPTIVEEEKTPDVWDNYAAPLPQEEPVQPVVVPEPPVAQPVEIPAAPVQSEVVEPITPAPIPQQPVEETPKPVQAPPEPDLAADLTVGEDLSSIYEQIQQAEQEDTPPQKE